MILDDFSGPLPIEGYDGKEIIVTNLNSEFKSPPDRAKGLKPVYAAGTDNTGIGVIHGERRKQDQFPLSATHYAWSRLQDQSAI